MCKWCICIYIVGEKMRKIGMCYNNKWKKTYVHLMEVTWFSSILWYFSTLLKKNYSCSNVDESVRYHLHSICSFEFAWILPKKIRICLNQRTLKCSNKSWDMIVHLFHFMFQFISVRRIFYVSNYLFNFWNITCNSLLNHILVTVEIVTKILGYHRFFFLTLFFFWHQKSIISLKL